MVSLQMADEIKPVSGQGQPPESEKAKAPTPPGTIPDLPEGAAPKSPATLQPPAHTVDKPASPPAAGDKPSPAAADKPATPVAADKPAAPPAAAKPAAPPPPPKAPIPTPQPWEGDVPTRMKQRFGAAILEAMTYLGDAYFVVDATKIEDILMSLRDDEQYNMLADLTAADYPKKPQRFEVIYQLYSFPHNKRLRVKASVAEEESIATAVPIWKAANWLEREVYDMFGVNFAGHPDLRRILLPEEWVGFPLRKDYHILKQDDQWVRENLHIESGQ